MQLEWIHLLGIGGALAVLVWLGAEVFNRRVHRHRRTAAALLHLDVEQPRFGWPFLDGMLGDVRVTVRSVSRLGRRTWLLDGTWTWLTIEVPGDTAGRLGLRWKGLAEATPRGAVRTGDPGFDDTVVVTGDEAEVRALFDASLRRSVLDLFVGAPFQLSDGRLTLTRPGLWSRPALLEIAVRRLVGFCGALHVDPLELPARLLAVATTDPVPDVRRGARGVLLERYTNHDQARVVAPDALEDPEPRQRLLAAMALGAERLGQVESFAVAEALPHDVRSLALSHLVDHAPPERVAPVLSRLFHTRTQPVLATLATLLGRFDHPDAEPWLVRLLDESPPVRDAAIASLAACGTVEAVEPLLRFTQGGLGEGDLRRAARQAIGQIQSRLGHAGAGQLTVSEAGLQAGALSAWPDEVDAT